PLAYPGAVDLHPAHAALRGERDEVDTQLAEIAAADAVSLLGENDDGTALRGLVRQRCQLSGIGQLLFSDPTQRVEFGGLPVAERDGSGLVEEQRIDIPRGFHRAARHGEYVETHQPIHAGDADRG